MKSKFKFFLQFIVKPGQTGSVWPSSRWLSRAMVKWIPLRKGLNILEFGSGTGVITDQIVKRFTDYAWFRGIEKNPEFFIHLKDKTYFKQILEDDVFNCKSIMKESNIEKLQVLISSLPLTLMNQEQLQGFFNLIAEVIEKDGSYSMFIYVHNIVSPKFWKVMKLLKKDLDIRYKVVFLNIPPAIVVQGTRK